MDFKLDLLPEEKRNHGCLKGLETLSFGQMRSDHMFVCEYEDGEWKDGRIVPYQDFSIAPGAMVLHYGQAIFEGAKAFQRDGELYTWRFDKNAERLNESARILCMPEIPVDLQIDALNRLLDVEREWCPKIEESSLYIRPFMFATQDSLGVHPSSKYTFCIMLSPSGPYYAGGFSNTVTLLVTEKFHRATTGGTGAAKACGNYAASLRAQEFAKSKNCAQVLYLDVTNTYLEEVGAMNHFHIKKDGSIIIPEFTDTILKSITSQSVLELFPNARQERIKIADFLEQIENGEIIEAGGFGTAAVITPVGKYVTDEGKEYVVGNGEIGEHTRAIYEKYVSMQRGDTEAPEGWLAKVPRY
ncbi:branched-chain amino acid aminotransferase [Halodesulfovibrio marinisediminis]|uniref:branched-chain-amino-acid transaminase n=1 Tax=Halodesulfovibrio marinisediminis DSM 17456 TaxID=1121457 RepID=A0A1N6I6P8_9BACT|nr:branched-chain amino acid aminotransferase [Halodesulfovibrio marinisediminis]SIO27702.1 branched-chain amino acid aminotransferase [Halodesulfovibrio marinisediminis DSM 17456]